MKKRKSAMVHKQVVKNCAKSIANFVAALAALPAAVLYFVGASVTSKERAFPGWSQALSLAPGLTGVYCRRAFYRWVLPQCSEDACISFGTVFSHPTVRIGSKVYVGVYCVIGDATIESDVLIASQVSITNGARQHGIDRLDTPVREQSGEWPHITIGRDTWIGDRAVVMADVGKHCVVGAGAIVTKPVPDFAIVTGNPARIVRDRRDLAKSRAPSGCEQQIASSLHELTAERELAR